MKLDEIDRNEDFDELGFLRDMEEESLINLVEADNTNTQKNNRTNKE